MGNTPGMGNTPFKTQKYCIQKQVKATERC